MSALLDRFDLEGYLEAAGFRTSAGKMPQMVGPCPFPECGSPDRLYVNLESYEDDRGEHPRGSWICFRCGEKSLGFARLYGAIEGLDAAEAKAALIREVRGGAVFGSAPGKRRESEGRDVGVPEARGPISWDRNTSRGAGAVLGRGNIQGFVPVFSADRIPPWRFPTYLLDRGVTREQARRYEIGFCNEGRYAGRIVFPIVCPAGLSFTARSVLPGARIRYLSGPGAGSLVFGWYQAADRIAVGIRTLVIAEGVFDALAYDRAGFASVALLGKGLHATRLIRMLRAPAIVLSLDPEAHGEAIEQVLRAGFEARITSALEGYEDPGAAPPAVLRRAVRAARRIEGALHEATRARLEGLL